MTAVEVGLNRALPNCAGVPPPKDHMLSACCLGCRVQTHQSLRQSHHKTAGHSVEVSQPSPWGVAGAFAGAAWGPRASAPLSVQGARGGRWPSSAGARGCTGAALACTRVRKGREGGHRHRHSGAQACVCGGGGGWLAPSTHRALHGGGGWHEA